MEKFPLPWYVEVVSRPKSLWPVRLGQGPFEAPCLRGGRHAQKNRGLSRYGPYMRHTAGWR